MTPSVRCRLVVEPHAPRGLGLAFELENPGPGNWHGHVFEPIVPSDLHAWADGTEVAVRRPRLNLPVRSRTLRLGPGERIALPSPVVLVFAGEGAPAGDPLVWVLDTPPPDRLELEVTVTVGMEALSTGRTPVTLP